MAELILGAVGFGLAAPGLVIAFAQCGEYIQKKVNSFRNAPNIVQEIGRFGRDLHQGKLKVNLELAAWAYSLPDIDPTMKDAIEDHVNKLRCAIQEVDYSLATLFDKNGEVRRAYFTILGERKTQRFVKSLKEWQIEFSNIIALIEMKKRVLPDDLMLSWDKYRPKRYTHFCAQDDILIGTAEIMEAGEARQISVLVERKSITDSNTSSEIKETSSILARCLYRNASGGGILKCIGFRQNEHAELIFELPTECGEPRILRDVIAKDQGVSYGGGHPLDYRFRLARQLCDAVLSVFMSGLVHKSIRTDTILLLSETASAKGSSITDSPGLGTPFLTSWTMLRRATGLTSGPGEGDHFKDFYRHPKRQGLQPEERYNMGHDIYSLGVCLLEISLWEPFFGADGYPSALYRETAVRLGYVSAKDADSLSKLTAVWVVAKVLLALAEQEIPKRMGIVFSRLVVSCLTCLEGGMGDESCFRTNTLVAAVRFNETVSQSFTIATT